MKDAGTFVLFYWLSHVQVLRRCCFARMRPGRNNGYVNEIKEELSAAESEYDFFSRPYL